MDKTRWVNETLVVGLMTGSDPHIEIVRTGGAALRVELSEVEHLLGMLAASLADLEPRSLAELASLVAAEGRPEADRRHWREVVGAETPAVNGNAIFWATVETVQETAELLDRLVKTLNAGGIAADEVLAKRDVLAASLFSVHALAAKALDTLDRAGPGGPAQRPTHLQNPPE
jgi:cobalamin biosynthesis protein CobD/CbiB